MYQELFVVFMVVSFWPNDFFTYTQSALAPGFAAHLIMKNDEMELFYITRFRRKHVQISYYIKVSKIKANLLLITFAFSTHFIYPFSDVHSIPLSLPQRRRHTRSAIACCFLVGIFRENPHDRTSALFMLVNRLKDECIFIKHH